MCHPALLMLLSVSNVAKFEWENLTQDQRLLLQPGCLICLLLLLLLSRSNVERFEWENLTQENSFFHDVVVNGYQSRKYAETGDLDAVWARIRDSRDEVRGSSGQKPWTGAADPYPPTNGASSSSSSNSSVGGLSMFVLRLLLLLLLLTEID
jgi:hypothetical protein